MIYFVSRQRGREVLLEFRNWADLDDYVDHGNDGHPVCDEWARQWVLDGKVHETSLPGVDDAPPADDYEPTARIGIERDLLKLASDIHQLKPTPAATEEYYGGYLEGRNDAFQLVMEKADAANDAELFADLLDALQSMIAWGEEPEPGTKSVRERELCKAWAKARTAISKATA